MEIFPTQDAIRVHATGAPVPIPYTQLLVASSFRAEVPHAPTLGSFAYQLEVDFLPANSQWAVRSLTALQQPNGLPVSTASVRGIPVERVLSAALWAQGETLIVDREGRDPYDSWASRFAGHFGDGPTAENLASVAEIYSVAQLIGQSRVDLLMRIHTVPRRTASHWVKLARERGHLPERSE